MDQKKKCINKNRSCQHVSQYQFAKLSRKLSEFQWKAKEDADKLLCEENRKEICYEVPIHENNDQWTFTT